MCEKRTPAFKQRRRPANEVTLAAPVTPSTTCISLTGWNYEDKRHEPGEEDGYARAKEENGYAG
ncbi:hypothetical protein T4A_8694 [Trichinella pseudospiralis]|uniref:Uncharacterized protein n=1 Tax=Trichinella pseudospiralis TaxID=6337 RepID=A0A0V1DLR2_TRIPS|nr:hypothetical protein T4A_8694 [Trichinella pseudospiralis]